MLKVEIKKKNSLKTHFKLKQFEKYFKNELNRKKQTQPFRVNIKIIIKFYYIYNIDIKSVFLKSF